ncbi:hypothetical protein I302_108538 [Kwoniella bestiolae CBS 10118]|uniref:Xylanolytic transcriptional activator regulatory domain-containing protein n=1 Tax=Kwoniella bestiolae CBS 10118 TaxID=1296100 RepID=A0AAJ8MD23_9TREE
MPACQVPDDRLSNIRNQPSPHLVPLLVKTFDFLRSITSPESPHADSALRPLIKQFLDENSIPTFSSARKAEKDQQASGSDATSSFREKDLSEDPVEEMSGIGEEGTTEGNPDVDELLMHMSLADDGQNGHFGVTSLFYQTPSESVVEKLQRRLSRSQGAARKVMQRSGSYETQGSVGVPLGRPGRRRDSIDEIWATDENSTSTGPEDEAGILKGNASMLGGWESLAYSKLELESDAASAKMIVHLLKTYFCWQYGSHCVVYRPVFIRDMALGGPYFNHFLLNVICAHATRYSDYHQQMGGVMGGNTNGLSTPALTLGADFMNRAKLLLAAEMDKGFSYWDSGNAPVVICPKDGCTQGEFYLKRTALTCRMAFRAMRDLGIHLDCNRLPIFGFGTMSAEDREIRRRLFWSAYTWDKIISLALGRTPTFNAFQNASPGPIVDDTEDDSEWKPYFWEDAMPSELANYPVQKSLMTSNFRHFIKLCEIIQKIIMRLYNGRMNRLRSTNFVEHMKQRLLEWMDQLPAGLRLDANALPEDCPPPHIFSTKIYLPNAVPVRTGAPPNITASAAVTCTQMAEELHQLFILYSKTFKLRNMTYTLSWSMYSAATINAIDFQSPDSVVAAAASPRLSMSLHVLERGSLQTPGTQRSIEIIKQRLRSPAIRSIKRPGDSLVNLDRSKRFSQVSDPPADPVQPQIFEAQALIHQEPHTTDSQSSTEFDLASILDASVATSNPPQTDEEEDILTMWTNLMQNGSNGVGNMDLLQGMMAMPSGANQYTTYPDWSSEWWNRSDP